MGSPACTCRGLGEGTQTQPYCLREVIRQIEKSTRPGGPGRKNNEMLSEPLRSLAEEKSSPEMSYGNRTNAKASEG